MVKRLTLWCAAYKPATAPGRKWGTITSTFVTEDQGIPADSTSMGVSAGDGMIHYVLFSKDDVGRSDVDSRVIDVDPSDGMDTAGRVNAGIDLMLDAAREGGHRVGPIGVAARTGAQRRELRSRGSGPRRQIRLVSDEDAAVAMLRATGEIERFDSVVIVDCGDTGMSLYTVAPSSGSVTHAQRSSRISGRQLDSAIADLLAEGADKSRGGRAALVAASRTAKEEVVHDSGAGAASAAVAAGGKVRLTPSRVAEAAAPLIDSARNELTEYLAAIRARGVSPEALVLIGGLANLPQLRNIVPDDDLEIVRPPQPELVSAVGAAMIARQNTSGATRVAFIGGRRAGWLSPAPVALAVAIIAAALMTVYAVGSSLAGQQGAAPTPSIESTITTQDDATEEPVADTTSSSTATTTTSSQGTPTQQQPPVQQESPPYAEGPGWATTELAPPTGAESPSVPPTSTLMPFPIPPPFTIPPELLPDSETTPSPAPSQAPNTSPAETSNETPNETPSRNQPNLEQGTPAPSGGPTPTAPIGE